MLRILVEAESEIFCLRYLRRVKNMLKGAEKANQNGATLILTHCNALQHGQLRIGHFFCSGFSTVALPSIVMQWPISKAPFKRAMPHLLGQFSMYSIQITSTIQQCAMQHQWVEYEYSIHTSYTSVLCHMCWTNRLCIAYNVYQCVAAVCDAPLVGPMLQFVTMLSLLYPYK